MKHWSDSDHRSDKLNSHKLNKTDNYMLQLLTVSIRLLFLKFSLLIFFLYILVIKTQV